MKKIKETYLPIEVTLIEFQVERGIAASVVGNSMNYVQSASPDDNLNDYTESTGDWDVN